VDEDLDMDRAAGGETSRRLALGLGLALGLYFHPRPWLASMD